MESIVQDSIYIDKNEFQNLFQKCWNEIENRFYKFENLQNYLSGQEVVTSLIDKDYTKLLGHLKAFYSSEKNMADKHIGKKIDKIRIHAVEVPLSNYLKAEYYTYYISSKIDQSIFFYDKKIYDKLLLNYFKDFMIFDDKIVILDIRDGEFFGGWYFDKDKSRIDGIVDIFFEALKNSQPFITMHNDVDIELINSIEEFIK